MTRTQTQVIGSDTPDFSERSDRSKAVESVEIRKQAHFGLKIGTVCVREITSEAEWDASIFRIDVGYGVNVSLSWTIFRCRFIKSSVILVSHDPRHVLRPLRQDVLYLVLQAKWGGKAQLIS